MRNAFTYGIKAGLGQYRIVFLVYLIQLALAVIMGMQVHSVMDSSIGHSKEIQKLITGSYDHTVISDFMIHFDKVVAPLENQAFWMTLVYLLMSVFINGGLLYAVVKQEKSWKAFWYGGANYVMPFLKIALFFLATLAVWTMVLWVPVLSSIFPALETLPSEATLLGIILVVAILYFLGLIFLFHASIVTRTAYLSGEMRIWKAIKTGLRFTLKKYFRATGLVLLFGVLLLAAIFVYLMLEYLTGMRSVFLTWMFVIIQQVLVFFRIMWRAMVYAGVAKSS